MFKNAIKFILPVVMCSISMNSYAATLQDLTLLKDPAYRLGTSSEIEKEYNVVDLTDKETSTSATYDKEYIKSITFSDVTLKDISKELSKILDLDKSEMMEDIQTLWAGAANKSETIKFAIYKLSNPDADKPDDSIIKKIVRPLASFSSIAGAGFVSPVAATTALAGSSLINSLSFNDKELNYKFTKVSDADMIMLIKKVDELQKNMINEYFDYLTSAQILKMTEQNLKKREKNYELAKSLNNETLLIADSYYRVALDNRAKAELEFLAQRAALEQLVGTDALKEFEKRYYQREKDK